MKKRGPTGSRKTTVAKEPEPGSRPGRQAQYELRLYVSGSTLKSARAVENIKRVCEEHLKDRYRLEVVDVYQQPDLARGDQVIAVPTLIKRFPLPLRRLIGDLSNKESVLLGLDLAERDQ